MEYVHCEFSKSQVDKAGAGLARAPKAWSENSDIEDAVNIINSYRSAHNWPLLLFRLVLTSRARKIDATSTVAQRLKRLPAIESKLRRLSSMRLTQMEDIGGCRAVVRSVEMVRRISQLYEKSRTRHKRLPPVDYLVSPRNTGYRGIHLIYACNSDRKPEFNGLKIEIQLRSRQQHAWATAVETVDAFTSKGLKDGSGDAGWQRFFALMSAYIASKERCNPVPNTPVVASQLKSEILHYANELDVTQRLSSYRGMMQFKNPPEAYYYVIDFDIPAEEIRIYGYKKNRFEAALAQNLSLEKEVVGNPKRDVVLVSVGSLQSLKRAYPNYFADTDQFLAILNEAIA